MRQIAARFAPRWRQLGWITLLAFTVKGLVTTTLILWALAGALD